MFYLGPESRLNVSPDRDHLSLIKFALLRRWLPRESLFSMIHTDLWCQSGFARPVAFDGWKGRIKALQNEVLNFFDRYLDTFIHQTGHFYTIDTAWDDRAKVFEWLIGYVQGKPMPSDPAARMDAD